MTQATANGFSLFLSFSLGPHDLLNSSDHETAVTKIWPIVLVQFNEKISCSTPVIANVETSCIEATNITEGSVRVNAALGNGSKTQCAFILFYLTLVTIVFF